MGHSGGRPGAGRTTYRLRLLAGTALLALAAQPALADNVEREVAVTLSAGDDVVTLPAVTLSFDRAPGLFGTAPPILVLGVDALEGNDDVTLTGAAAVQGTLSEFRIYTSFPLDPGTLADMLAPPRIQATAIGVDAGPGDDRVRLEGALTVSVESTFTQADFDIVTNPIPGGLFVSLESQQVARAVGLEGGEGADRLEVAGTLAVSATSDVRRGELTVQMATFGDIPQVTEGLARAVGLSGGSGNDMLLNAAGATIAVSAISEAVTAELAVSGVTLASPENATIARALADGMAGGEGSDTLDNEGALIVSARADVKDLALGVAAAAFTLPEFIMPEDPAETLASATARGIVGGAGPDRLLNLGSIALDAEARLLTVDLAVEDAGIDADAIEVLIVRPELPDEPPGGAQARIAGMVGDGVAGATGPNSIINAGSISGTAKAVSETADISIAAPINSLTGVGDTGIGQILGAFSLGLTDVSSDSAAWAVGIDAGAGNDVVVHTGTISMTADSQSDVLTVDLDVLGFLDTGDGGLPFELGLDVFSIGANSYARSLGIGAGAGRDIVQATRGSNILAEAKATSRTFDLGIGFSMDDQQFNLSGTAFFGRTWADAGATGIDGGAGNDIIRSEGTLLANAQALAQLLSIGVDIGIISSGLSVSGTFVDTQLLADARGTGIRAGDAIDLLFAGGTVTGRATATIETLAIAADIDVSTGNGVAGNGAFLSSDQKARAQAAAVDRRGPLPDVPDDDNLAGSGLSFLQEEGRFTGAATANASRIGIGANVTGTNQGLVVAANVLGLSQTAKADAAGFLGGDYSDRLDSRAILTANAAATSQSTSVSIGLGIANNGVAAGVGVVLADTLADAHARAVDLGGGNNVAFLSGALSATANATNNNNSGSVAVSGVNNGVGVGGAGASMETTAKAVALGLAAGDGADDILAEASINSRAIANANTILVGVGVGGAVNGVGVGAALARTDAEAVSEARAVSLGGGDDRFETSGPLTSRADATANTTAVEVALGAAYQGVGVGAALVSLEGRATADSIAVDGGSGDDEIRVSRRTDSRAYAIADNLGVAVGLGIAVYGVGAGGAGLLSDVTGVARATGLQGGLGNDIIHASDMVFTLADAVGKRVGVSVGASGAIGAGVGATFVEGSSIARATATGIAGDVAGGPGGGDDLIISTGGMDTRATARATGANVNVAITISIGVAANIISSAVDAVARGLSIDGGAGNDVILADGSIRTQTTSIARSTSVSVTVGAIGLNLGDFSTSSTAHAGGIAGGAGDDEIEVLGTVTANANADTEANLVGFAFTGASLVDAGSRARAFATGIDGGPGDDSIRNFGTVTAHAQARTPLRSIQVGLTGAAGSRLDNLAESIGTGIAAGDGDDSVLVRGNVTGRATSTLTSLGIGFNFQGVSGNDMTATSRATATAISLGNGANQLDHAGQLTANAAATAQTGALTATLVGAGGSLSGTVTQARATGAAGGTGQDMVRISGAQSIQATASTNAGAAGLALTGVTMQAPTGRSEATAFLADLGGGNDHLELAGTGTVTATAQTTAGTLSGSLTGVGLNSLGGTSRAVSVGVAGGAGNDWMLRSGTLTVNATATTELGALGINLVGGGIASVRATALAEAIGIDGGTGDDRVESRGTLRTSATTNARYGGITINALGGNSSETRLEQSARSLGVSGGAGNDTLLNFGTVDVIARTNANTTATGVQLLGGATGSATSRQTALATGMDGGTGNDLLVNEDRVLLSATAVGGSQAVGVTLAGASIGSNSTVQTARIEGMLGGAGTDILENLGRIEGTASSTGRQSNISATGAGWLRTDADNLAIAEAVGMDGGAGNDVIASQGRIVLGANATGATGNIAVQVLGAGNGSVQQAARSTLLGIDGGAGNDQILNAGLIGLTGSAVLTANSRNVSIAGGFSARSGLFATSSAVGLDGGAGNDLLVNQQTGRIELRTSARVTTGSGLTQIVGGAVSDGLARTGATVVGMAGGTGNDILWNLGIIDVGSNAQINGQAGTFQIVGSASTGGDFRARADAVGMDGGAGNDEIASSGQLRVLAESFGTFRSTSFQLGGLSRAGGAIGADAVAFGLMATGTGNNIFTLTGGAANTVTAFARATVQSSVQVVIGSGGGQNGASSTASATGIQGSGLNDDVLVNAPLAVNARAEASFQSSNFTFLGASGARDSGLVRADAIGVALGNGRNSVDARGNLQVNASVQATGSASAGTVAGRLNAAGRLRGLVNATGFSGGSGLDTYVIGGGASVIASSRIVSSTSVTDFRFFTDGIARSFARSDFDAALVRDTDGATTLHLLPGINAAVSAGSTVDGSRLTLSQATSSGARGFGIDADARATADAQMRTLAAGILSPGGGTHNMLLEGNLLVLGEGLTRSLAQAFGNSAISGDGTATATATVTNSQSTGISAGGLLRVENSGLLQVFVRPTARATAQARATGVDIFRDPDARATGTANANNVQAIGVSARTIDLWNRGTISVTAAPRAEAIDIDSRRGGGSISIDAFSTGTARANDALAIGVQALSGSNRVVNDGSISATSAPVAVVRVVAQGAGADGDATARATASATNARAFGIQTGSGNDEIVNRGTITVSATPAATATATANKTGFGKASVSRSATVSSARWGIFSAGGNNVIVNEGSIMAVGGVAIETGAGNDQVVLRGGVTRGEIRLGAGNDLLVIENNPIIFDRVFGGPGTDRVQITGAVSFQNGVTEFENLDKFGAGTASLGPVAWSPSGQTRVVQGQVLITGGLTNAGHTLVTTVYGDGSAGTLRSQGSILPGGGAILFPSGTIRVDNGGGVMVNGRTWDVVTASLALGLGGATIQLPAPTALVSFSHALANGNALRVSVNVSGMGQMIPEGLGASFGAALDAMTPVAQGQVAGTISALQALGTVSEVRQAVEGLTPRLAPLSLASAGVALDSALAVLAAARDGNEGGTQGLVQGLAMTGGTVPGGGWAAQFSATPGGSAAAGQGQMNGIASGFDTALDDTIRLGFGLVRQVGSRQLEGSAGAGQLESTLAAVSADGRLAPGFGWSGVAAWGVSRFDGARAVPGASATPARLGQDARLFALEGGLSLAQPQLPLSPTFSARLGTRMAWGAATRETSGEAFGVAVDGGRYVRTEGSLGVAFAPSWQLAGTGLFDGALLSLRMEGALVHRFSGAPERVTARLAGMPDHPFDLRSRSAPRDALAMDLGVQLDLPSGPRFSAGVASRPGDRGMEQAGRVSLTLPF